jgi:uncharacterized protein (TIGR03067 family)
VSSTIKAANLFAAGNAAAAGAISAKVAALTEGVLKAMLLTKLKLVTVPVMVATLTVAAILIYRMQAAEHATERQANQAPKAPNKQDTAMNEQKRLQGTWTIVSGEEAGKKLPEGTVKDKGVRLTIDGNQMTFASAGRPGTLKATFTVDPAKQPKTITLTVEEQNGKTSTLHGIYEIDGDSLKLCYGQTPPAEFKTKADREADQRLYVLQREK